MQLNFYENHDNFFLGFVDESSKEQHLIEMEHVKFLSHFTSASLLNKSIHILFNLLLLNPKTVYSLTALCFQVSCIFMEQSTN